MAEDFKVGDKVEAGWVGLGDPGSSWHPPRGVITALDGTHYRVRWENGYEANFRRTELRLRKAERSRFKAGETATEGVAK